MTHPTSCVGIGTAMFRQPAIFEEVAKEMQEYLARKGEKSIGALVGKAASA